MKNYCYFNGKIVAKDSAKLSLSDLGMLRSYSVFDFARIYNGKPFLYKEHLTRFENSAKMLGLKVPLSQKEITKVTEKLLKVNKAKEASIRLVLTGGENFGSKTDDKKRTFYIMIEPAHALPPALYKNGAKMITLKYHRSFPEAKTTNYSMALYDASRRKKEGAVETLFITGDKALEATTSNFFLVKKDLLVTPSKNILIGTTRNYVMDLARKNGFIIEERDIHLSELDEATEAFITATNKEIVPIVMIDNKKIGDGKVGRHTRHLMEIFRESVKDFK